MLIYIAIEAGARLAESPWYPSPLRAIAFGLFLCGVLLAGTRAQWFTRRVEARVDKYYDQSRCATE